MKSAGLDRFFEQINQSAGLTAIFNLKPVTPPSPYPQLLFVVLYPTSFMNYLNIFDGIPVFVENHTGVGDSSNRSSHRGHYQVRWLS